MNDSVVAATTTEDHFHCLRALESPLKSTDLKLTPTKCDIVKNWIRYFGLTVNKLGVHPDEKQFVALTNFRNAWNPQRNVNLLRSN